MTITKADCEQLRRANKGIADDLWAIRGETGDETTPEEVMPNLTLAYRHLEDAAMRLGKVMQALDGGTSVYDRSQTPGA